MKGKERRLFPRCRSFGISGALILAIWLATAIASSAQTFNVLFSFDGTDGRNPYYTSLVQGKDGNYYGTTGSGGSHSRGAVFRITPSGGLTTLYSFCYQTNCLDGDFPLAGLTLATDGNFYGTTWLGGANQQGTVFEITPGGTLTTLYSFCSQANCADGALPWAGLVQATDGNLYGTTWVGGANTPECSGYGCGTVFKITPGGALTTLYRFCSQTHCRGGAQPQAGLVQASDGNFYGTTTYGGASAQGTVFKITPAGKLTTLYSFCSRADCADGAIPYAGLVQGTDGNFYGTTMDGGANSSACSGYGCGTIFKISPAGNLTTLYTFCSEGGANCADGMWPIAGLLEATDGSFHGTTIAGGANGDANIGGTIFKIDPAGALTTLYSFCSQTNCADGSRPYAGLLQGTNGSFYGTTYSGGAYYGGDGTVFNLSMGLGPFVTFVQPSGKVGWRVEILGQGFTGTTGVSFNGTPATFTVKRDTYLTATVPAGVTTGPATVTTPGGILTSNVPYRVRPTILSFSPTSGPVGTPVTITGVSLTQTQKVNFGGVHASFTVNSDTQVTATVPTGAQTGKIAIVTLGGQTWSTQDFTVTQ